MHTLRYGFRGRRLLYIGLLASNVLIAKMKLINIGNQKKMIIIRIIQEFVEKYKYTEAEGIMLGAFISAGLWTIILYFIF